MTGTLVALTLTALGLTAIGILWFIDWADRRIKHHISTAIARPIHDIDAEYRALVIAQHNND